MTTTIKATTMQPAIDKKEKADITRQRILDAAATLFRENGYASASIRAIAAVASMKAGSVYYHFASKEQIVIEVLNIGIEKVHAEVEAATAPLLRLNNAENLLKTAITAHLTALFEFSDYTSANVRIYGQIPKEVQKGNIQVRRKYETLWDELLTTALVKNEQPTPSTIKAIRLLIIGSLNATLEWFNPQERPVQDLADEYAILLLHGILNQKGEG